MSASRRAVVTIVLGSTRTASTGKSISSVLKKLFAATYADADITVQEYTPLEPYNLLAEPINALPPLKINTLANPDDINKYDSDVVRRFSTAMAATDGFVFVLPVYNHSYPGGFKIMLDHIYHELRDKPVYIIGYGPSSPDHVITDASKLVAKFHMKLVDSTVVKLSYTDPDYLSAYVGALSSGVATLATAALSHAATRHD